MTKYKPKGWFVTMGSAFGVNAHRFRRNLAPKSVPAQSMNPPQWSLIIQLIQFIDTPDTRRMKLGQWRINIHTLCTNPSE